MDTERFERDSLAAGRAQSRSIEQRAISEQFHLMYTSPLFAGLSHAECDEVLSYSRLKRFARNEMIFLQGEPFNKLVMVHSGMVKVTQTSLSGQEVILRVIRSRDTVGLHADSQIFTHACSACAMESSKAFVWEYRDFRTIESRMPRITANIHDILSGRLVELEKMFSEIATGTAAQRLGLTLLRLLERVGEPSGDGIAINLRREELSQMTGLTVFTISRALAKWARSGLVVPRREAILVRDLVRFRTEVNYEGTGQAAVALHASGHLM
ncbi:Crp/Fnr family transcriptional regulator [Acidobacteria bacterium AB60]|nr:Crp/Fnr family transcriptional regulator [Acidobacteria bacterium AB60]